MVEDGYMEEKKALVQGAVGAAEHNLKAELLGCRGLIEELSKRLSRVLACPVEEAICPQTEISEAELHPDVPELLDESLRELCSYAHSSNTRLLWIVENLRL